MDRQIDRTLRQMEEGLLMAAEGIAGFKAALASGQLGQTGGSKKPWGRMRLSVLAELERRGRVPKHVFVDIGEHFGYNRQGMAGFYQELVTLEGGYTVLTDEGRHRLASLRERFEELPPTP